MSATIEASAREVDPMDELPLREKIASGLAQDFRLAAVAGVLVLIWLFFFSREPLFLSSGNLSNLAAQTVVTGVLALGVTFVLFIGEIDLSVGALGGVLAAGMGRLIVDGGLNPWLAVAVVIAGGAAFGAVQGLVVIFGAPSFMVTLGASIGLGGALLLFLPPTGSIDLSQTAITDLAGTFLTPATSWLVLALAVVAILALRASGRADGRRRITDLWSRRILIQLGLLTVLGAGVVAYFNSSRGVPVAVAIMLLLYFLAWYVTTQTRLGISIFAVGGNREASRRAGLRVEQITVVCFAVSGSFAALAGIFAASRVLGVSNQSGGGDLLLQAIAAAVIGGTSLFGGRGSVWSALLGALTIGSISNGMDLLGLATEIKLIVTGGILIMAVAFDAVATRGQIRPIRG